MKAGDGVDLTGLVVRALATELKVSEADVRAAKSLKADLGMDSIAAVNVAFALEDECDLEINIGENDTFDSVEAIVAIVERAFRAR